MKLDNDFSEILHESKYENQKPMLFALFVVIVMIAAVSWAVFAYLNQSAEDSNTTSTGTTKSSDEKAIDDTSEPSTVQETPSVPQETPAKSPAINNPSTPSNQPSNSSSSNTYDPSKCDSLRSQADSLKTTSDQKKTTYDKTFTARKNYGYFYDQYGNSTDAQRAYDVQETQLNSIQNDWQNALNKQNATYNKYQECRSKL